mmetsp:Transcript_8725/g.18452  ORF Transcript_8725/g.18452 Transcript_8725/m.18452 type:complete len:656 (+) Transcript_8725:167-2134(+)
MQRTEARMPNRKRAAPRETEEPKKSKARTRNNVFFSAQSMREDASMFADAINTIATVDIDAADEESKVAATKPSPTPVPRGKYRNWNIEPYKSALSCAVLAELKGYDGQTAAGDITIPRGTLQGRIKQVKAAAAKLGLDPSSYLDDFNKVEKKKTLTTEADRNYIKDLVARRDLKSDGMTGREVIAVIQTLSGANFKTAENHWHYLRRKNLMPELKNNLGTATKSKAPDKAALKSEEDTPDDYTPDDYTPEEKAPEEDTPELPGADSQATKLHPTGSTRGKYKNWSTEPYKSALCRAVEAELKGLNGQTAAGDIIIPRATLQGRIKQVKKAAAEKGGDPMFYINGFSCAKEEDEGEKPVKVRNCKANMLTNEADRKYIQQLVARREEENDRMSTREMIEVIQTLSGADAKTAENHWQYLRRKKISGFDTLPINPKSKTSRRTAPRGKYTNWNAEPYKSALARAIEAELRGLDGQTAAGAITIPRGTLQGRLKQVKAAAAEKGGDPVLYINDFKPASEGGNPNLLTNEADREYIQQLMAQRELENNRMSSGEVVGVIQTLTGADFKSAQNHLYYLRRKKMMPDQKNTDYDERQQDNNEELNKTMIPDQKNTEYDERQQDNYEDLHRMRMMPDQKSTEYDERQQGNSDVYGLTWDWR